MPDRALVPEIATALAERRRPVIRSDGRAQRDFLYVEDAVRAYFAIWSLLDQGRGAGEAFNAERDRPHSVLEVVTTACRVAGSRLTPEIRARGTPEGEINRQWLDSSKLCSMTGWAPQISLEEGLRRTLEWYEGFVAARAAAPSSRLPPAGTRPATGGRSALRRATHRTPSAFCR